MFQEVCDALMHVIKSFGGNYFLKVIGFETEHRFLIEA